MSAPSHDQYHPDTKPVAFTVPFILALVTIIVMGLFLSLCDPAPHGSHGKSGAAHGQDGHHNATENKMNPHGETDGPPAHPEGTSGQHN